MEQQEGAYRIVFTALFIDCTDQEALGARFSGPGKDVRNFTTVENLPYLVRKDAIGSAIGSVHWKRQTMQFRQKVGSKSLSLGLVDDIREEALAGSLRTMEERFLV